MKFLESLSKLDSLDRALQEWQNNHRLRIGHHQLGRHHRRQFEDQRDQFLVCFHQIQEQSHQNRGQSKGDHRQLDLRQLLGRPQLGLGLQLGHRNRQGLELCEKKCIKILGTNYRTATLNCHFKKVFEIIRFKF